MRALDEEDTRQSDAARRLARLTEVDRATVGANVGLCAVAALLAWILLPFYGWPLTLASSLPFVSWVVGLAGLRRILGIRRWTALNLATIESVITIDVAITGGVDSPLLHMVGVLGVFIVFYFPGRWQAVVVTPCIVAGITAVQIVVGTPIDDPLNPVIAFLIALILPVATIGMVDMEMTHRRRAVIDPLTGCLNRNAFRDRIEVLEAQMAVTGEPIGVVIFDIDHFKRVNDEHGHAAGDAVLTEIAYQLRKALRSYELLARLGGEEFVILLPGANASAAAQIAERVRLLVEGIVVDGIDVTISCGAASAEGTDVAIRTVLADADAALYEAKAAGRNRTRIHMPEIVSG